MAIDERARLRIRTFTPMSVSNASEILLSTQDSYNGIHLFTKMVERIEWELRYMQRIERHGPPLEWFLERGLIRPHWITSFLQEPSQNALSTENEHISVVDQLILKSAQISSPGFWEFLGKLNPLEVIRLISRIVTKGEKTGNIERMQKRKRCTFRMSLFEIKL